jgi:hypothetical protein
MHGIAGLIFIIYATVIYPVVGMLVGHGYPQSPVFGVAPCPTVIFTFGFLLWAPERVPIKVLIPPVLWAAVGTSAAVNLGMFEDLGLLVAGLATTVLVVYRNRKLAT